MYAREKTLFMYKASGRSKKKSRTPSQESQEKDLTGVFRTTTLE